MSSFEHGKGDLNLKPIPVLAPSIFQFYTVLYFFFAKNAKMTPIPVCESFFEYFEVGHVNFCLNNFMKYGHHMISISLICWSQDLKEYYEYDYEIVDEARPLSGFFPTHADLFTEMHL